MINTRIGASERRYNKDIVWTHILSTKSKQPNWCFNRFRLFNPDSSTLVRAFDAGGNLIAEQLYNDPSYTAWNWGYDHTFMFDLSFNTAQEEIAIHIGGVPSNSYFQQLYAVNAHAGSAVRYSEDPNVAGTPLTSLGAELTYVNMGFLKFGSGGNFSVSFVYIENQAIHTIDGADQHFGRTLDARNNNIPATTADSILIGCDANGGTSGTIYLAGNNGRTSASDAARASLISKSWTIDIA